MYTNQVYNQLPPKQNKTKYTDTRYTTHLPHSQQRNIQITRYTINLPISYTPNLNIQISLTKIQIPYITINIITNTNIHILGSWFPFFSVYQRGFFEKVRNIPIWLPPLYKHYSSQNLKY